MEVLDILRERLHSIGCSCVIGNADIIKTFHRRGVKDLYELLSQNKELLAGASIADKVVGKGAAALMIAGGIKEVYADIISQAALELFNRHSIMVKYDKRVSHIINRSGDDICPVEKRCSTCETIDDCIIEIEKFLGSKN